MNENLATLSKRILSFSIDEFIVAIFFSILVSIEAGPALSQAQGDYEKTIEIVAIYIPYLLLLKISYHTFFIFKFGATLGKFICKIRCVSENGELPSFWNSFLRSVIRCINDFIFYLGFLTAFFDKQIRTLHDVAAKTLVVKNDK